jgi:Ser/Thr protein kinase RdoA (MazF antagonist)
MGKGWEAEGRKMTDLIKAYEAYIKLLEQEAKELFSMIECEILEYPINKELPNLKARLDLLKRTYHNTKKCHCSRCNPARPDDEN